jgi:hypothetical protein
MRARLDSMLQTISELETISEAANTAFERFSAELNRIKDETLNTKNDVIVARDAAIGAAGFRDQTQRILEQAEGAADRANLSETQTQAHATIARDHLTNVISVGECVQTSHEAIIRHMHSMFGCIPRHIKTTGDGAFLHIAGTQTLYLEPGLVLKDHSASGAGGAVALKGNALLDLPNVQVFDNEAGTFGGAFVVSDDAKLSLLSNVKGGVSIAGNKAGGKASSIHFTKNGRVELIAINENASIKIYDPITDDDATQNAQLEIMGAGTTKLYTTSSLDHTNILVKGSLQLKSGAGVTAKTITVADGGQFSTVSGKKSDVNAQTLKVYGTLAVEGFGDGSNDTISANTVEFSTTSLLEINLDSRRFDELDFEVVKSSVIAIDRNFKNVNVEGGSKGHLVILRTNAIIIRIYGIGRKTSMSSMSNLTKNQKSVATVLDNTSRSSQKGQDIDFIIDGVDHLSVVNAKAAVQALSQLNGYFLANVIRDITNNNGDKDAIYSRMNSRLVDNKADVWGQIKGDYTEFAGNANSLGDHKDTEVGAIIGYNRYLTKGRFANKLLLGAYSKVNKHYVSQSNNNGEMTNAGLGLVGLYNKKTWEAKAIIDGSYHLYSTRRHVQFEKTDRTAKANFSGMGLGFDIEGALKKDLGNQYTLKPYIGFEARVNYYGDIQEKGADDIGLTVDGDSYNRMFARTGLGVKRDVNKYTWNANIEYKHLLTDTVPTIISRFGNSNEKFESLGSEEGRSIIGIGAGSSYKISDSVTVFADVNVNAAEKFRNVQSNIGMNYKFGMYKKEKRKLTKEEKANNLLNKNLSNKVKTYIKC